MSFLSMCIHSSAKTEKARKHSRKGPGQRVAPFLGPLVPTNINHLDEPIVRKYSPPLETEKQEYIKQTRAMESSQQHLTKSHIHCNCENESQKSATCSSTSNESHTTDHTSGYQTEDDGTFESKMLRMATRSKPANIRMTALKDYNPCCNEELVLRKGQRVKVLYKNNDWVYAVTKNGEAGYVPYNYVRPSRKYAGYQSEPEFMAGDTDYYQSGYDTDMPYSGGRRYGGGARTQIGDVIPTYSIHTGFRESPESYVPHRHASRLGSGGSNSPPMGPPRSAPRYTSGYTSAVEYPTVDTRRHPRPAKSLHSLAGGSPVDRRPSVGKPAVDTFSQEFLEELVVIHDFEAHEEDEVFISKGERVKVFNAEDPFWLWVETSSGMQGFVPRSCCSLGNHPYLQSNSTRKASIGSGTRHTRRYYHHSQRSKQIVARQARNQAKQRFHELQRQRNNAQNPVLMEKEDIQRVGSKLIVLMDYTATQDDELNIQFAETVYADVLKQAGAERIWTYCPRTEQCGFVPVSLLVPPVV